MTAQTASSRHLLLTDLRPLSNQETQRSTRHPSNRDSCETLKPSGSNLFSIHESDTQEQKYRSGCFEGNSSVSPKPRLCRHPSRLRGSRYTRFFGFERGASTQSQVVVQSPWLPTGALFVFRLMLFVYGSTVLVTDLARTDRPRYEFCYLTQLSYLGLMSYLGTVSWHTLSEWRRQLAQRKSSKSSKSMQQEMPRTTTIERQHWFLTDMIFFLYHTICTFHVIVPIMFWGYSVYAGDARMMAVDLQPEALWRNYSFHGGDLAVMLLEVLVNAMPFIPSHLVVVMVICLLYLGEAHVVHYVDGFWIYPFLDTSVGPIWMVLYLGVGVAIMCAFAFMYYLHRVRNWVWRKAGCWTLEECSCTECAQTHRDVEEGLGERGLEPPHPNSCSDDTIQSMTELPVSADEVKSQYYQQQDQQEKAGGGYFDQVRAAIMRPLGALSQSQNRKRSSSSGSDVTLVGEESVVEKGADLERRESTRLEKVEEENEEEIKEAKPRKP